MKMSCDHQGDTGVWCHQVQATFGLHCARSGRSFDPNSKLLYFGTEQLSSTQEAAVGIEICPERSLAALPAVAASIQFLLGTPTLRKELAVARKQLEVECFRVRMHRVGDLGGALNGAVDSCCRVFVLREEFLNSESAFA